MWHSSPMVQRSVFGNCSFLGNISLDKNAYPKADLTSSPDTFEKSGILHDKQENNNDIKNVQKTYEIKYKFADTNEEIALILPKNPDILENNKYDEKKLEKIRFILKHEYGEGIKSRILREFQNIDSNHSIMDAYKELVDDVISNFNNGEATNILNDPVGMCLFLKNPGYKKLSSEAKNIFFNSCFMGDSSGIQNLDKKIKCEIDEYLKYVKDNFSDIYKKILLDDVNNIYNQLDECVLPLENDWHVYRGIHHDVNPQYTKFLSSLEVGETVTIDNGMLFTAAKPNEALQYASDDGALLHIVIPKGAKMMQPYLLSETCLPPMAKFKVLGSKQVGKNGLRVIDLEYLIDQGTRSL